MDLIDVPAGQRILHQGKLMDRRECVRDVLVDRFGTVPTPVIQAIQTCEDLELLKKALLQALHVQNAETMLEHLQGTLSAGSTPDSKKGLPPGGRKEKAPQQKVRGEGGKRKPRAKDDNLDRTRDEAAPSPRRPRQNP